MVVNVSVEVPQEYQVQEISYDGQEIFTQPLSMSENFTGLASKIDFGKRDETMSNDVAQATEDEKEVSTFQTSLWPWDSVRSKLKTMLTEISVLIDVLNLAKEKRYMVLDSVSQEHPESKSSNVFLQKKNMLGEAASILLGGAERLRMSLSEISRPGTISDFHLELLQMRQNWRLKRGSDGIIVGDLSHKTVGSRYFQNGIFRISKSKDVENVKTISVIPPTRMTSVEVDIPNELEGVSYIHVSIQNDTGTIANGELTIPVSCESSPMEGHWQQRLEAAQNVMFCKELFSQLAREAVQLQSKIPNLVVGNQITSSLFPDVQLNIGLCHSATSNRAKSSSCPTNAHKPVLEHSLHQLLRELHYNSMHHPMPHPTTSVLGISRKRKLAGPHAFDRQSIIEATKSSSEFLLEKIIKQTRHVVLRLRTMYIVDTFACDTKDPLIVTHWACLTSPTVSTVKINITSQGYDTICRTSLVIHVEEKTLKVICRDGRTMILSYEAQELQYLLMCQVSQHQINAAQALTKLMGWKVLSASNNIGIGLVEAIGNCSTVLMASPTGDKLISVRCGPKSGIQVNISSSPQQEDFYPSTLVKDRKWQNLMGDFKEVCWDKMEGKNFLNKLELLMASLMQC